MHARRKTEKFFGKPEGLRAFGRSRYRREHDVIINVFVEQAKMWKTEDTYSAPPNAKVKNEWSCIFTPPHDFVPCTEAHLHLSYQFKKNGVKAFSGFSWLRM